MWRKVLTAATLLMVGVALSGGLNPKELSAADRPPLLTTVEAPSPQPQGYWICVTRSNGQCVKWKTCIRWQGGTCEMWVYVYASGGYYCTGANWWQVVDCPTARATPGSEPRLPLEVWVGELVGADDRPVGVQIRILGRSGRVVLAQARAEECGPLQRSAMAMLASEWAKSPQAHQVWSRAGCEVTVAHRDFPDWVRRLREGARPADTGDHDAVPLR